MNTVCSTPNKKFIFTGSADGSVALWNLDSALPIRCVCDHTMAIISLDLCYKLNLIATASLDGTIVLRDLLTGRFFKIIKPKLKHQNQDYEISHIRLSYRGYVIIVAKIKEETKQDSNLLMVYSINGEEICMKEIGYIIQVIILDDTGYYIVVGGKRGILLSYNLITLESKDLIESLKKEKLEKEVLKEFMDPNSCITALQLKTQERFQQLFIGLNTGSLFVYKFTSKLVEEKIFVSLKGLLGDE